MMVVNEARHASSTDVPSSGTCVPKLGTLRPSPLADALFGRVRGLVLALFFGHPDRAFYTREVIQALDVGQGAVQRELKSLSTVGILVREPRAREVYYRANADCPIHDELLGLTLKTLGLADVLRSALSNLAESIDVAFVYGSVAKGTLNAQSDVDVMVVGTVSFAQVVAALTPTEEVLGREVNPSVYSAQEFRSRAAHGDHFVTSVLREPMLFLLGGRGELDRLAGQGLADKASDEQAGDR